MFWGIFLGGGIYSYVYEMQYRSIDGQLFVYENDTLSLYSFLDYFYYCHFICVILKKSHNLCASDLLLFVK